MKKIIFWFLLPFWTILGCSDDNSPSEKYTPIKHIELDQQQRQAVIGYTDFSYDIFKQAVHNAPENDNIVLSPWSAISLVSLMSNCGDNATRNITLQLLNQSENTDLNKLNRYLSENLTDLSPNITFDTFRSIWRRNDLKSDKAFDEIAINDYSTDIFTINPTDDLATLFSTWVNSKTNGFFSLDINPTTPYMAADLLYFKGPWKHKFDKDASHPGIFHNADGTETEVTFMERTAHCKLHICKYFTALFSEISRGEFNMIVILPAEGETVTSVSNIISDLLQNFSDLDPEAIVHIFNTPLILPKFNVEANTDLSVLLSQMGQTGSWLFTDNDTSFDLIQSSRIEVAEDGATVSSATITNDPTATCYPDADPFVVDRPFIYIIQENSTGIILQMGKICKL